MKLWKRASGVLKDQKSIWIATLSRRNAIRNPEIEAAVIKATSHDEFHVDYQNAHRVFAWIRMAPAYFRPFAWALYVRMERTRSWVVALKGLMLMHGVFCCKVPAVQKIGRLPFDLSNFKDGHLGPTKSSGFNAFIHAYFAFLDQKSAFISSTNNNDTNQKQQQLILMKELVRIHNLQSLLDMLLKIRPQHNYMKTTSLILEAMDCIVIEILDIYSQICNGIAHVLLRICSAGKVEAEMALKVLKKATLHGEELSLHFKFCRDLGVLNASQCPKVERIPEDDFREVELIINGASKEEENEKETSLVDGGDEKKANIVMIENATDDQNCKTNYGLKTIITNKWEAFDEDLIKLNDEDLNYCDHVGKSNVIEDPFSASLRYLTLHLHGNPQHCPDLISFS